MGEKRGKKINGWPQWHVEHWCLSMPLIAGKQEDCPLLLVFISLHIFLGSTIRQQAQDLEEQFGDIEVQTYDKICESGISVGQFKARLKALPLGYRSEHGAFFEKLNEDLGQITTVDGIWDKLSSYWSFLNYTLLESLIQRLKYDDLKEEMSKYITSLRSFQKATLACDFSRYYSPLKEKNINADLKNLVVHFHLSWRICTLEDVIKLQGNILRRFHLPSFVAEVKKILAASLIVSWLLPKEIAMLIKEHLKSTDMTMYYVENGILSISIDGEECINFSSSSGKGN